MDSANLPRSGRPPDVERLFTTPNSFKFPIADLLTVAPALGRDVTAEIGEERGTMKEHEAKNYKEYAAWQRQEREIGRTPGAPTNSHYARTERAFMDQRNARSAPRNTSPAPTSFQSTTKAANYTSPQSVQVKDRNSRGNFGGLILIVVVGLIIAGAYGHVPPQRLFTIAFGLGIVTLGLVIAAAVLKFAFRNFWLLLCAFAFAAYAVMHH
jgi:hypothetical protein